MARNKIEEIKKENEKLNSKKDNKQNNIFKQLLISNRIDLNFISKNNQTLINRYLNRIKGLEIKIEELNKKIDDYQQSGFIERKEDRYNE